MLDGDEQQPLLCKIEPNMNPELPDSVVYATVDEAQLMMLEVT